METSERTQLHSKYDYNKGVMHVVPFCQRGFGGSIMA
jgi:hypothetical protein